MEYSHIAAMVLFGIGFTNLLLQRNFIKKIIGFGMMDSAIFLFLASMGMVNGAKAPIIMDPSAAITASDYINPVPGGLVLTGIVVSVSVTALMLALAVRLYRRYGTLDIDKITDLARKEEP